MDNYNKWIENHAEGILIGNNALMLYTTIFFHPILSG